MKTLRIAIVVGETSGDLLGAGLMRALKKVYPAIEFEGIGGSRMIAEGFDSLFAMDRLAVMGLIEPLKRLPELLRIRKTLRERWIANPPDIVIGIDAPDFNLDLELRLREAGIKTAHYVSPSVWAWRKGRIKKIRRAVDLMLCLFPFEEQFYRDNGVPVVCVGHPLADDLPMQPDVGAARQALGLAVDKPVLAVMPGSRSGEVGRLAEPMLQAMQLLHKCEPDLQFVLPAANPARRVQLNELLAGAEKTLPLKIIDGESHLAMTAADVVLMASGTTTLEAMLLKKPMVIVYKMAALSFWIMSKLATINYVGLPNLLIGREVAPELLQDAVQPQRIADLVIERLHNQQIRTDLQTVFRYQHQQLRRDASATAALAILKSIGVANA
jgi:lipid-A-disaccharide synthase